MNSWQDQLTIAGFIFGVLSFVLALIGTWGIFRGFYRTLSLKATERKINQKVKQLEEIDRFNKDNYLLAYVLQKIVIMLIIFFIVYVSGIKVPAVIDYGNFNYIIGLASSWIIGNLAGNSYRACRNVIKSDQLTKKLNDDIDKLRAK